MRCRILLTCFAVLLPLSSVLGSPIVFAVNVSSHATPDLLAVVPFFLLLGLIATGPIFFARFWHNYYHVIAIVLASIVLLYYLIFLGSEEFPIHTFFEYFQFISLISALFIAAGGINLQIDKKSTPTLNVMILFYGALLSNIISTTGASMLLIYPFIRLNKERIKPYHIVFFIFIVSNAGGCLTPIGDPPLFLGFLKGVPFFWNLQNSFLPWIFVISSLLILFFYTDSRANKQLLKRKPNTKNYSGKLIITGKINIIWIIIIIGSVFIDPAKLDFVPAILIRNDGEIFINSLANYNADLIALNYSEDHLAHQYSAFSFVRELIMLTCAFLSFRLAGKEVHEANDFSFEPIREVAYLFIGIFFTMMPALELISIASTQPGMNSLITASNLYWVTGTMSAILDNAPTYLNFFTACISSGGGNIHQVKDVVDFCNGTGIFSNTTTLLQAISVASVFFGAMTYIGNGPNFMVKAIAEQAGISMPSFFGYVFRFSLVYLLPTILICWLIFFA